MLLSDRLRQFSDSTIARNSTWIASAQLVIIILMFVLNAILARILGPERFGIYQMLIAWLGIGAILSLPGFGVSILRAGLKGNNHFFWKALRYSIISSCLGATVAIVFAWAISTSGILAADTSIFIVLIAVGILTSGFKHYDSALIGARDYKASRLFALLMAFASLFMLSFTAYLTRSPEWVFVAYLASNLSISLAGLYYFRAKKNSTNYDKDFETDLLRQGWRQTAVNVFTTTVSRLDKIALGAIDPVLLSYYFVGTLIPQRIMSNSKSILGVFTAEWGAGSSNENRRRIFSNGKYLLLFGVFVFFCTIIMLPIVIPIAFGDSYLRAVEPGQWFSLILIAHFWFLIFHGYDHFQFGGKNAQVIEIIRQIIFVILLLTTISQYGISGVVFAHIASHVFVQGMALVIFYRGSAKDAPPFET